MSTPSWLQPLIASWKIKNYLLACDVNALVAATANSELENKNYSLACDVTLVAATANRELENKNYSLACDVNTFVAATANSELENKKLFARLRCQRPCGCDR
jgi:hypothetical protein